MAFKFSLLPLLKHRKRLEDEALKAYADAQAKVDAAEKQLQALFDQIDDARVSAQQFTLEGGAQSTRLEQIDQFINLQKILIEKKREAIRDLRFVAETKHELLIEAVRERKTLERLREHRQASYKLMLKKQELKQVDEMVVTRFGRNETGDQRS
jgi:flagellar FliJ protein